MGLEEPTPGGRHTPEAAIEKVRASDFDPRPQIIYNGSGFDEPDKPVDDYTFYMLHEGRRYFVTLTRDGVSDEIISSSRSVSLGGREEEERRFHELEAREKLEAWRNKPECSPTPDNSASTLACGNI